ncbi:MAG: mechanosensitive ion channel domain-containing protein [Planctomycetota bacterium]
MYDWFTQQMPELPSAIALAVGFPLVLLFLNELIGASERRGKVWSPHLRTLRNLIAPSVALLAFVRLILKYPQESFTSQMVETIVWVFLLYATLGFVNDIVFGWAQTDSWRQKVPTLFRDLLRAMLVAIGAMVIYSQVWGNNLEGALTALGVGSVVVGLALQEPLGNIVSGLMLLFERPLNVGDWVNADGAIGKVIEINWRSVHIETPTRELRIVPNVSLYKGAFSNLSRPTPVRTEVVEIGFSYDDAPNRVKEVMQELLTTTPGVLSNPAPVVRTVEYADFSVNYRLIFSVSSQENLGATRDAVMTRLWYIIRREGLTIPYPIQMEYGPDESPSKPTPTARQLVAAHPRFLPALSESAAEAELLIEYAAGEVIADAQRKFAGVVLIVQGRIALSTKNHEQQYVKVAELLAGECIGDHMTVGSMGEETQLVALTDVILSRLEQREVERLLNSSPTIASSIGDAIEVRRQAVLAARRVRRR